MNFSDTITISLVIILLLLIIGVLAPPGCWPYRSSNKKEGFNTYRNQSEGAYDIYTDEGVPDGSGGVPKNVDDAETFARYAWNNRDPTGMTVYDKYYENYNGTIGDSNSEDSEYAYRDISSLGEENVYDTKFENLGNIGFSGNKMPSMLASYSPMDMKDRNPARAYSWQNDEDSIIAQKNY